MSDPFSSAAIGVAGQDAQGVVTRLLGPTADIMGKQLSLAYRESRLFKVFERAASKVNVDQAGTIPPRVVKEVMEEAQWADSTLLAEYFSGVLAASRNVDGSDDSGVSWASLLGRLSSDQLALHWILYCGTQKRARAMEVEDFWAISRNPIVVPLGDLLTALRWSDPIEIRINRLYEALYGLQREQLIDNLSHGPGDYLSVDVSYTRGFRYIPDEGYITCKLTEGGGSLLLQVLGRGRVFVNAFFDVETSLLLDATQGMPSIEQLSLRSDYPPMSPGAGVMS